MTFDITGLTLFLLAVMPGFIAQQSRHSLVPRPLESKTALEETGEYVLNSLLVHLFSLACFCLVLFKAQSLTELGQSLIARGDLRRWGYEHRYLATTYLCFTLVVGFALGLLRGYLALRQPVRNKLSQYSWFRELLTSLHIPSFIEDGPVWHDVLRDRDLGKKLTFVQIKMKNGSFYTGALERYSILKDSEKNKDFYLVNAYFRASSSEQYQSMQCKGVLLNFSDVEAVEVFKKDGG
jgi:hypothetical protein